LLIVNTASECGFTPQYAGLQKLFESYEARGLTVLGFPCNQFGEQEPGSAEEIASFCSLTYGVTFPMFEKIEVNGPGRNPLYAELSTVADAKGKAGDVEWNFEKFVVSPEGEIVARFRPKTSPDAPNVVALIESLLPRG
jgi:glutathione peroxidase